MKVNNWLIHYREIYIDSNASLTRQVLMLNFDLLPICFFDRLFTRSFNCDPYPIPVFTLAISPPCFLWCCHLPPPHTLLPENIMSLNCGEVLNCHSFNEVQNTWPQIIRSAVLRDSRIGTYLIYFHIWMRPESDLEISECMHFFCLHDHRTCVLTCVGIESHLTDRVNKA